MISRHWLAPWKSWPTAGRSSMQRIRATTSKWPKLSAKFKVPLAVKGETLEELADLTTKIKQAGVARLGLGARRRTHGRRV